MCDPGLGLNLMGAEIKIVTVDCAVHLTYYVTKVYDEMFNKFYWSLVLRMPIIFQIFGLFQDSICLI